MTYIISKFVQINELGTIISTCPLALASEFLKKGLSGKYIIVFTFPNGQADHLNAKHIFCSIWPIKPELSKQCNKTERNVFKSLNP